MDERTTELHEVLARALDLLDRAAELVESVGLKPKDSNLVSLGVAVAEILQVRKAVHDAAPLLADRSECDPPDASLSAKEEQLVASLSPEFVESVDSALISHAREQGRKVATMVMLTMQDPELRVPGLPDLYYASRVRALVANGRLVADGDIHRMRYCEVRLP